MPKPKTGDWSGLISAAWNGYMRNKSMLVPIALPALFSLIIALFQYGGYFAAPLGAGGIAAFAILVIVMIPVSLYASAAAISIVKDSWKGKAALCNAWKTANKKFWSVLGASLLVMLLFFAAYFIGIAVPVILMLVSLFAKSALVMIISLIWMLIGFIALIALSILLGFTVYAVIISDLGAVEGLKASWNFVRKNFWPTIVLLLINFLIGLPIIVAAFASGISAALYPDYQFYIILLEVLVSWLISPFLLMMSGYFYMQRKK
jgi:hypothetical protein